ncbi:MAG: hypothetical protein ACR2F1_15045 [Nitrososphaeraceae archaeon]
MRNLVQFLFVNDKILKNKNSIYRNSWMSGSTSALEGIMIFNNIIRYLRKETSLTIREIIKYLYIENSDLASLNISKMISYLDEENKILYNKKR